MLRLLKKDGFASIVEVVVASVIFVISAIGIFSSLAMLRPQGTASTKKLAALYAGKQVMDDLRGQVYGNMWTNPASPLYPSATISQTISSYTVSYYTVDVPGLQLRKMMMNVQY